jgi:hypothetical protein
MVKGARYYTVQISGEEKDITTKSNSVSLESLKPGEYEIKIRANSDNEVYRDSDWATYSFKREAESGLKYQLINNDTEFELVGGGKASGDVVMESIYRGLSGFHITAPLQHEGTQPCLGQQQRSEHPCGAEAHHNGALFALGCGNLIGKGRLDDRLLAASRNCSLVAVYGQCYGVYIVDVILPSGIQRLLVNREGSKVLHPQLQRLRSHLLQPLLAFPGMELQIIHNDHPCSPPAIAPLLHAHCRL